LTFDLAVDLFYKPDLKKGLVKSSGRFQLLKITILPCRPSLTSYFLNRGTAMENLAFFRDSFLK